MHFNLSKLYQKEFIFYVNSVKNIDIFIDSFTSQIRLTRTVFESRTLGRKICSFIWFNYRVTISFNPIQSKKCTSPRAKRQCQCKYSKNWLDYIPKSYRLVVEVKEKRAKSSCSLDYVRCCVLFHMYRCEFITNSQQKYNKKLLNLNLFLQTSRDFIMYFAKVTMFVAA